MKSTQKRNCAYKIPYIQQRSIDQTQFQQLDSTQSQPHGVEDRVSLLINPVYSRLKQGQGSRDVCTLTLIKYKYGVLHPVLKKDKIETNTKSQ